jgi:hypothetical protein
MELVTRILMGADQGQPAAQEPEHELYDQVSA